jgi:hypothetical protein
VSPPPNVYDHVVWIVMENHSYEQIIGATDAPYLHRLATQHGLATNFYAESHPSLPNYIAMSSGSTQGIGDDDPRIASTSKVTAPITTSRWVTPRTSRRASPSSRPT